MTGRAEWLNEADGLGVDYLQPPGPPIWLAVCFAGSAYEVRTLCGDCNAGQWFGQYEAFVPGDTEPSSTTVRHVVMLRRLFRHATHWQSVDDYDGQVVEHLVVRDLGVFIGQCPRCRRIYLARATD